MLTLSALQPLIAHLTEIARLHSAAAVLAWDQETYMPAGGADARAAVLASLEGAAHERFIAPQTEAWLAQWMDLETGALRDPEAEQAARALLREVRRDYLRAKRLPTRFVTELERTCSLAQHAWLAARERSDWPLFLPHLTRIVSLKREEAGYLGYTTAPYDALLDGFEPGMTTSRLAPLLADFKARLVPLLAKIAASPVRPPPLPPGSYDGQRQLTFGSLLLSAVGYEFARGRLDQSAHPFTTGFHPTDVRITTRVAANDITSCLFSCLHEGGHGLYDQGLDPAYYGTPLGESVSLGLHESQSRLWENCVGRSLEFWRHFYPRLQQAFPTPLAGLSVEAFHAAVNTVRPSLIRVDADELTYNLHIVVRYELEQALIDGRLAVAELPEAWNDAMRTELGVTPKDAREGVLQDIHWAHGAFGYFPTYTLGNLYAAQFWQQAQRDIVDLPALIEAGSFTPLVGWLRDRIHRWGRTFSADTLLRRITGEPLNADHFMAYAERKFGEIYRL